MVLDFPGIKNIFGASAEDGQVIRSRGDRGVPDTYPTQTDDDFVDNFGLMELDTTTKWTLDTQTGSGTYWIGNEICTLSTGTTDESKMYIKGNTSATLQSVGKMIFEARVKTKMTAATEALWYIGLDYASSDRALFYHTTAGHTIDQAAFYTIKDNSGKTTTPISFTNNEWHNVKIVISSTSAKFYVDNVLIASHTEHIPDDVALAAYFGIWTKEAKEQTMQIDWVRLNIGEFTDTLVITDGVTAPASILGQASIYIDNADGDLKVKFADGFVAVLAADS